MTLYNISALLTLASLVSPLLILRPARLDSHEDLDGPPRSAPNFTVKPTADFSLTGSPYS